jgi:hypothetical protein
MVHGMHLDEELLWQVGSLEDGDSLLTADVAVLVQIHEAEVGLEGLHARHHRDPSGVLPMRMWFGDLRCSALN